MSLAMTRRRATARRVWGQFRASRQGLVGLGVLLVFVAIALAAPLLADARELNPVFARAQGNPQWASSSSAP
jgi:peptide/nickel transport system permease protein